MASGGCYTLNTIDRPAVLDGKTGLTNRGFSTGDVTETLRSDPHGAYPLVAGFKAGQSKDGGLGYAEEQSPTLSAMPSALEPTVLTKAYSFDALSSNSMKSSNPNSGCRQTETAKTLDCFDPNPSKNQGGIAVVASGFDGQMGPKAHGIAYEKEKAPTLKSGGGWSARSMQ